MKSVILLAVSTIFSLTGILQANPADIYPTGKVDMLDFAVFAAAWLSDDSPSANWNPDCDISDPNDGFIDELDLAVLAANWLWTALDDMVFVYIDDDGTGMTNYVGKPISHGGFTGEMSKYKTTNAQYCEFLNAALASGDIIIDANDVIGANGSNAGADFVGEVYFGTYPADEESQITYSGGVFSVRSRDGYDMRKHPVVMVNWYGATAFCNYYGYHLPTEWEWQAVADFDGSYNYGCGVTIDHSKANYDFDNPLGLSSYPYTSPVNHYSSYGYGMNDMAGNAWEWTSTVSVSCRVIRSGCWSYGGYYCDVSYPIKSLPSYAGGFTGFRVCR